MKRRYFVLKGQVNSIRFYTLIYGIRKGMKKECGKEMPERGVFAFYDCLCISENEPMDWGHCGISLGDKDIIHASMAGFPKKSIGAKAGMMKEETTWH